MTRAPLGRDSATFSANDPQHTMLKKEVCSSHSLLWRFCQRRLTARPKLALGWPLGVNRSSGSRVMFPVTVTWLSGISNSVRGCVRLGHCLRLEHGHRPGSPACDLLGDADDLVADHFVSEVEHPVELVHGRGLGGDLHEDVVALPPVVELIGETPLPPSVDPSGVAPSGADRLGGTVEHCPDGVLLQAGVEDDHDFIRPQAAHLPLDPADGRAGPRSVRGRAFDCGSMVLDTSDSFTG